MKHYNYNIISVLYSFSVYYKNKYQALDFYEIAYLLYTD